MLRRIVVVFALSSLLLAACSSGDDGGGATGGTTGGTTASGETASGETASGATATGATGGDVGSIDTAQCAEVAAAMSQAANAMPDAFSGNTADLDQSLEQLRAFAEAAPEEIRADVQTIVEGYSKIVEAMQSAGYDPASGQAPPPEVIAALTELGQELNGQEFQAAVQRVNEYFAACSGA